MEEMFYNCQRITPKSLNLRDWDVKRVKSFRGMFKNFHSETAVNSTGGVHLDSIPDLSRWQIGVNPMGNESESSKNDTNVTATTVNNTVYDKYDDHV